LRSDSGKSESDSETLLTTDVAAAGPAGGPRRLVEIRCGFAEQARTEADAAAARAAEAKRLYDERAAAAVLALAAIDPAANQVAKDEAHRSFRAAVAAARSRGQVEAAGVAWLDRVNEINAQGRAAQARIKHEREAADALLSTLARLSDIAEATAAMAESAMQACREARAALAAEASAAADAADASDTAAAARVTKAGTTAKAGARSKARSPARQAAAPPAVAGAAVAGAAVAPKAPTALPSAEPASVIEPAPEVAPAEQPPDGGRSSTDWLVIDIRAPDPQAIIRLLRRDGRTMNTLVDRLAGADPAARRCWQLLLSDFVDGVVAAAIEDACLDFPATNPFWDQFTPAESREVALGLSALGFRYDGFSAFVDGRVPGHRDLALAVGSTGLLPARVHYWPKPDEAAQLYQGVRASADTFIASRAPALTLGELVRMLGRRAEPLADLWNDWPRVRPLLFSTDL
jgi:hypothetical protein